LPIEAIKSFQGPNLNDALIVKEHPLLVIESIIARRGTGLTFTYSQYEVAQPGFQAAAPRSPVLRVRASDISPEWMIDRFRELKPNEELAWHSLVECDGSIFHIPMIDLASSPSRSTLRKLGQKLVTELSLNGGFVFFETGQSFHGYFPDLMPERAWFKYLGHLLVLEDHDWSGIIDTRWVGHALVRGFSALRWSNNTSRYKAIPRLAGMGREQTQ
jgi:hypothetical protein